MISNEERREVANWLRLSGKSLGFDNCFVQMLCDVAGTDLPPEDFDAAGYLADLIDRPTTKRDDVGGIYWRCHRCGAFNRKLAERPKSVMKSLGDLKFEGKMRRMRCLNCGAVHWELANKTVRFSHCPYCGIAIDRFIEEKDRDE